MDYDTKKLKGIILHPWDTKRIYDVKHLRTIVIDNYPRTIESDFQITLRCVEDNKSRIWKIDKTSPVIKNIDEKDRSLQLLKRLEAFTYPLEVRVDACGNFVEMTDHSAWVESWRLKAKKLAEEEYDVEGNVDIFQQFYEILLDEQKFINNKNRESFWKLLFLNFKIAVPVDADFSNKESFSWDLMQLGTKLIKGTVKSIAGTRTLTQHFKSRELLDKDIIESAISLYGLKPVNDIYAPVIKMDIEVVTHDASRMLIRKKAVLDIVIEDQFKYKEEINIIFNDEIT